MSEWKPIESAPTDGMPVLLFARSKNATASVVVVGWYIDQCGGWIECAFAPNGPVGIVPSHWMPLPEPPEIQIPGGHVDHAFVDGKCSKCGCTEPDSSLVNPRTDKRYTCEEWQTEPPAWVSHPNVVHIHSGEAVIDSTKSQPL